MISNLLQKFYESMNNHQIKTQGISWFSMVVTLHNSDNEYMTYPVRGVLRVCEQSTSLGFTSCIFHHLKEDGSLGAPVTANKPIFTFEGGSVDPVTFVVGDIVKLPANHTHPRKWVVLEVTQEMLDHPTNPVQADEPGLYAFGGMWYGDDPLDHKCYGKIAPLEHAIKVGKVGDFNSPTVAKLKEMVD